ncbi:L-glutamate gamma-semialdehyde dehydrogenase [Aliifodinibius sp. S!AR15-10]|uniref:L-glutamate gamma-semialdehyde dehydrogenase n=1 Tax=Aliifodinibius sp. S!AR15-10 TaxID=2950437 RepID=UPI002858C314|nr:L-glutamate gamma-semialdehyde dehydrogenase [Aliifodinibius sp. S!AR15-10]MDR8392491.1 L-glutamate gamma-semialdehyde dehydrogenase [Aliifodinibius sp. S!AR15-10]
MANAYFEIREPENEPVNSYAPGTPERSALKDELERLKNETVEIPAIIGGEEVKTGNTEDVVMPHNHGHKLGTVHLCGEKEVKMAEEAALEARKKWADMPWEHRASVFKKAADLLSGPWRYTINAATMLGQSKTPHQSEIDAVAELVDFFRYNSYYLTQIYQDQPYSPDGMWNRSEYRPLEGFVFAVTPFNFTSIAGNLPTAPAICGNVALWKPATSSVYSSYFVMKLLEEAGLPKGVVNFIPGSGADVGNPVMNSENLSGLHFTGSTATFQHLWKQIANNIEKYKTYPRIVGETGGKDFIFAHKSSDVDALVVAALRAAYEYQGQKCSAASRIYIPESIWSEFSEQFLEEAQKIKMGDVEDFSTFMGAVIDQKAFDNITSYIDYAKEADDAEILLGGEYDDSEGYFVQPTLVRAHDPKFKTMEEEIFGPVLTVYVYEDAKFEETLELCDTTSPYALTGSIFAQDRDALKHMSDYLRQAAGNFYINDKPTAAVVNQQPFGGARKSGTNDKAGSAANLMRWLSVRSIKESTVPPKDWTYPYMGDE